MRHPWLHLLLAAALLSGCATSTVRNPVSGENERTVMDEPSEIAEGKKSHQQVLEEYGVVQDARLQAYVNDIGQRLAKQSERSQLEWHFTVLDSAEINAFALPGGYVYVTRGIMAYMESEADLAGVIGHEIGHVAARHGAQRATRQQTAGIGVFAATIVGAVLEVAGVGGAVDFASQVSQRAAAGYIATYGREQESQADKLGAAYLARSNCDPRNMVDVIQVLKNQERFADDTAKAEGRTPGPRTDWLSSHPSNDKRLQDIQQIATQYKGRYGDDGRARYLQAINGMTFGESREQGVTRGRNFYHEPMGFALTAPPGWPDRTHGAERSAGHPLRRQPQHRTRPGAVLRGHRCQRAERVELLAGLCLEGRRIAAARVPADQGSRRLVPRDEQRRQGRRATLDDPDRSVPARWLRGAGAAVAIDQLPGAAAETDERRVRRRRAAAGAVGEGSGVVQRQGRHRERNGSRMKRSCGDGWVTLASKPCSTMRAPVRTLRT
jgi:Zn-dependent protease with chaperone function